MGIPSGTSLPDARSFEDMAEQESATVEVKEEVAAPAEESEDPVGETEKAVEE